jgi:hypothetical protein
VSASGSYSVAVPKSWVVLDLSTHSFQDYRTRLASTDPRLAYYFSSNIFDNDPGLPYTDFFAADPADPAPTPLNARVEHFTQPGNPVDSQADIASAVQQSGDSNVSVRTATVAGHAGVIATGTHTDKSREYRDTNVFVECHPNVQCVLVLGGLDNAQNAATANSIIRSLSIS